MEVGRIFQVRQIFRDTGRVAYCMVARILTQVCPRPPVVCPPPLRNRRAGLKGGRVSSGLFALGAGGGGWS